MKYSTTLSLQIRGSSGFDYYARDYVMRAFIIACKEDFWIFTSRESATSANFAM